MEATATADIQRRCHHEQSGRLHLTGFDTKALPALPLLEQVIVDRGLFRAVLSIEGILALHNAHMGTVAQILGGRLQGGGDVKIRHCRELNGCILQRSMLETDGATGDHHITGADVHVDAATGADTDKSVRTDRCQLFHGDGCGGTTDAGRADGDLLAEKRAVPDVILTVHAKVDGVVEVLGNRLAATGIAGEKHIAAYVALVGPNVKLHTDILHINHPFV